MLRVTDANGFSAGVGARGINLIGRGAKTQRPRSPRKSPYGASNAKVKRIHQLPIFLDLLALKPDIGDPMLSAAVSAAGYMKFDLLIESRKTFFHLAHQPLGEAFGLGDGKFAELSAGARNRPTPECRDIDLETKRVQRNHELRSLRIGNIHHDDVLHDRRA